MNRRVKIIIAVLFTINTLCIAKNTPAKISYPNGTTPIEGIFHWKLENGLDVFAVENHTVPLVYIEIAVKAGGITQTRESAGLFHLYEHMMFKGNSLYRSAAEVQKAISDFGVPDWNGTTGLECVNYFFTVPKHLVKEGMEFWEKAITSPLLDASELEREKKVVLSEITADTKESEYIESRFVLNTMFPDRPWQVDPSGDPDVVKNATVDEIKEIQKTYYVPNNAALFVAGDIEPYTIYSLAKELYGKWQRGEDVKEPDRHTEEPLKENKFSVSIDDKVDKDLSYVTVYMRGPDTIEDIEATYAGDAVLSLFNDPKGPLCAAAMENKDLGIVSTDRVGMGYQTRKVTSLLTFTAMLNESSRSLPRRTKEFLDEVKTLCASIAKGKTRIPMSVFKLTRMRLKDENIRNLELPSAVKSTLRYWWTVESEDYYFGYDKAISKVKEKDIRAFLTRYTQKNALVTVTVNEETYRAQKDEFLEAGFTVIKKEDALWR